MVDGPDGATDASLRPNQLFALSLEPDLVDAEQARERAGRGPARVADPRRPAHPARPAHPRYERHLYRRPAHRDGAYHQGTVWPWLLGAYGDALRRWAGADRAALLRLLAPLQRQLAVACAGTLSEIFDARPAPRPRGAFAQAWSVAEVLRLLRG